MRHGTDMSVESNYVDSHGASFIGFGITRLLDFDLIARFKQINQIEAVPAREGRHWRLPAAAARADPAGPLGHHRAANTTR